MVDLKTRPEILLPPIPEIELDAPTEKEEKTYNWRQAVLTILKQIVGNAYYDLVGVQGAVNSYTTAELEQDTSVANTVRKFAGLWVLNSTSGRMVYASGSLPTDVWKFPDGTTAHTPV